MRNLRIGLFLGWRQIKRSNIWASTLIISVVTLTVINLIVISGILNGITDGVLRDVRNQALGDIAIKPADDETRIKNTQRIMRELETYQDIQSFTPRYEESVTIEANYNERRDLSVDRDIIAVNIQGIDPITENQTLGVSTLVNEGEYLTKDDRGYILIGKHYVDKYAKEYGDVFDSLKNIEPGTVVKVSNGYESREFTVKGIINSKIDMVSLSVFMPELDFRRMFNRVDYDANKILIKLKPGSDSQAVVNRLLSNNVAGDAKIELFEEGIPKYIKDVTETFNFLSTAVGTISIFVATITVFIIIFINTLSRRQHIGILKAVGINKKALQYAYAFQATFYGLIGVSLSLLIIFFLLVPYFIKNPIDFPYTDVELSVSTFELINKCLFLLTMMLISGFIPAWMIVRKNTLDSILGRK